MISYVDKYGEFSILDTISFLSAAAEKTETIIDNYRYLIYLSIYPHLTILIWLVVWNIF
jgi:hypothetical protein